MFLFRKEAVDYQSKRLMGTVTLAQPLSIKLTVFILASTTILILIFFFNATYSRKETVRGFLIPDKGVIRSYANQAGTIEKIWVEEGDIVSEDQPLVTLVMNQSDSQGEDLSEQLMLQLEKQSIFLSDEITQHEQLKITEIENLASRLLALKAEKLALQDQQLLTDEKLEIVRKEQEKFDQLHKKGHLSNIENKRYWQKLLEIKQEKKNVQRLLIRQDNELAQVHFQQKNLPKKTTLKVNLLKRKKAEIEQEIAKIKSNYRYTLKSSNAGVVSGVQVVEGETINSARSLLHIIPENSSLVAELLLPTRTAGFVQKNDLVRLRLDAFPYQRFGFIKGSIVKIDQSLIVPEEVKLPISLSEPVYRIRAMLNQQSINAYGQAFKLKSGMLFEADIILEERSLIEWVLDPIYSLRGRVN